MAAFLYCIFYNSNSPIVLCYIHMVVMLYFLFCNSLSLPCRFFNEFLLANERYTAKEVRDEYVNTMSKIYYSYFKGYTSRISKLQVCLGNAFFVLLLFHPWRVPSSGVLVALSSFSPAFVMSLLHASFHLRFGRSLLFPGISTCSAL